MNYIILLPVDLRRELASYLQRLDVRELSQCTALDDFYQERVSFYRDVLKIELEKPIGNNYECLYVEYVLKKVALGVKSANETHKNSDRVAEIRNIYKFIYKHQTMLIESNPEFMKIVNLKKSQFTIDLVSNGHKKPSGESLGAFVAFLDDVVFELWIVE